MTNTISRRGLIGTALAFFGWRPKPEQVVRERPWTHLANFERDDVWADFVAWETWMDSRLCDMTPQDSVCEMYEVFETLGMLERGKLYWLMCECADGPAKQLVPPTELPF